MRALLLATSLTTACGRLAASPDGGDPGPAADAGADAGPAWPPLTPEEQSVLAARPYRLVVPSGFDGGAAVPLVMLLHGYSFSGQMQDMYFGLSQLAQARTFLLATPDGLKDTLNQSYWNATDYCCGSAGTQKTDDVFYLTAVMNDVRLKHRVDPRRVFFIGHSNGGFMSHRMACDRSSRIAAIVSFAGAQWKDVTRCAPDQPVSALQLHGDMDLLVAYGGGTFYPGALETARDWAMLDGCDAGTLASTGANLDLVTTPAGAETRREGFGGCPTGVGVELWTIQNGGHVPMLQPAWAATLYDWLLAHPK